MEEPSGEADMQPPYLGHELEGFLAAFPCSQICQLN